MGLLDENLDITLQDIIKNVVVKILAQENPNNIEIIWESCDWPRIVKRPDKNIVYYYHPVGNTNGPVGKLYIHIGQMHKKPNTKKYLSFNYRMYRNMFSDLPVTVEEMLHYPFN